MRRFTTARATRDFAVFALLVSCFSAAPLARAADARPNFVLCMADDQGWGDVGYYGNPVIKTPVMDDMAASGLRFDRFYAAAPVCSPTRGSVLTGRHPNRFGCFSWGHLLRPQEITLAESLRDAGYATGHFGKWHLGPVRAESQASPAAAGFERWFSAPNFFENSPLLSANGKVIQTEGEGSRVTVDLAIQFIREAAAAERPFLAVVWFGSPHAPHEALPDDLALYPDQPERVRHFLGEMTAMDRALGVLRDELRRLGVAENTVLWYNSDNGAIPQGSTGGLSEKKGALGEGGIRVPAIVEWPARVKKPRVTQRPASTVDILPTVLELAGVAPPDRVLDGESLAALFDGADPPREKPLGFWVHPTRGIPRRSAEILRALAKEQAGEAPATPADPVDPAAIDTRHPVDEFPGEAAWIDGDYKLRLRIGRGGQERWQLFDLAADPVEQHDLAAEQPDRVERMRAELHAWRVSVARSLNGDDY